MVNFNLYYDPSPALWELVENNMSSFWKFLNSQKGCISLALRSLLPDEPILCDIPVLRVVQFILGIFHRAHLETVTVSRY